MTYFPAKVSDRSADTVIGAAQMGVTDTIMPLPQAAEDKLDLLRRQKADYFALLQPVNAEEAAAFQEKGEAETRIRLLGINGFKDPEHPSVKHARGRLEEAEKKIARVRKILEHRQANKSSSIALVHEIERYIKAAQRRGPLTAFTGEVNVPKGDPSKVLSKTREAIAELKADRHKVRSSPYPSSVAKAHVKSLIDELAARGRPSVAALLENVRHIEWKSAASMRWEYGNLIEGSVVAGVQLVAWLERDRLLAALYAEIDEMADDKNALTEEERTTELARIEAQALELERIEEHLVEELGVDRRPDADPRAVLHIDGPVPTQEI